MLYATTQKRKAYTLQYSAVPLRLENNKIGEAMVLAAPTRPKFIGGARAAYDENLI